jgi:regulator of protease activity HflC (stomatin/prohibitin superfamily)
MKKLFFLTIPAIIGIAILGNSCTVVPAGYKGVKVYVRGNKNGSETTVLNTGRYYFGPYQQLYLFPMYQQDYTWGNNESRGNMDRQHDPFTFQSKEGIEVTVDLGISFHIIPDSVKDVFMKWRKDIDYIANVYFDDLMHDALIHVASRMTIEQIYGTQKNKLVSDVDSIVEKQVRPYGIVVDRIFFTGDIKLPPIIVQAINQKMQATQIAQQRENELREVEAEAKKKIATANGESESKLIREKMQNSINVLQASANSQVNIIKARGDSATVVITAKADSAQIVMTSYAQAKANKMLQTTVNEKLIEMRRIEKWDGVLPTYSGMSWANMMLPKTK